MIDLGFAREAGDDIGAKGELRRDFAAQALAEFRHRFGGIGTIHSLQDSVRSRLERDVERTADVGVGRQTIEDAVVADAWLEGTEAHAVDRTGRGGKFVCASRGRRQFGQGGEEIGEVMARIAIEREIAAGDDELAETGIQKGACAIENGWEGERCRRAPELGHDAKGAAAIAAILDFYMCTTLMVVGIKGLGGFRGFRGFKGAREATCDDDFRQGKLFSQSGDGLFAFVLRLGCHAATTHDDTVDGDSPRMLADGDSPRRLVNGDSPQRDDFVSGGEGFSLHVQRLGAI